LQTPLRHELAHVLCCAAPRIGGVEVVANDHGGPLDWLPGFGDIYVDEIRPRHIEAWRTGVATLIADKQYAPTTANGWLYILKHVMKRAKRELQLPFNAADGTPAFDTSEHEIYTEEEPNALTSEETAAFLACMKEEFPGQYAMTYLGGATGLLRR
jgi:hypothetical protein